MFDIVCRFQQVLKVRIFLKVKCSALRKSCCRCVLHLSFVFAFRLIAQLNSLLVAGTYPVRVQAFWQIATMWDESFVLLFLVRFLGGLFLVCQSFSCEFNVKARVFFVHNLNWSASRILYLRFPANLGDFDQVHRWFFMVSHRIAHRHESHDLDRPRSVRGRVGRDRL